MKDKNRVEVVVRKIGKKPVIYKETKKGVIKMEKSVLYGIIGGLAGLLIGILISGNAVNNRNYPMMGMMGMRQGAESMMLGEVAPIEGEEKEIGGMDMSMSQMSSNLATLRGAEFDKEFIRLMTDHHLGAIDMAELALTNFDKEELKKLAEDIIRTQSDEIEMMQKWNNDWFGGE